MTEDPLVDFILPGRWWRLTLGSDDALRRAARAMALDALGRADQLAQLRSELITQVLRAAGSARAAGGTEFYFGLEIAPGMPLPMSLTVYWPDLPLTPSRQVGPRVAAEALAESLAHSSGGQASVVDSPDFGVVRVVKSRPSNAVEQPSSDSTGDPDRDRLDVSYWVLNPESARTLMLSFSTTLVQFHDAVVELGDAIVSSVMWREQEVVDRG